MRCNICPRKCDVDRSKSRGLCGMPEEFLLARAAKHFWEEPPVSGTRGSGTVFFSGCNLGCVYCQNYEISHEGKGKAVTDERLKEIFTELTESGVHNINLVNPTHYAMRLRRVMSEYSCPVPVVYNSSGYERVSTLKGAGEYVDVYLPDLKYITADRAGKYSNAPDYFEYASKALIEMKNQQPENIYDEEGIILKGLIVRHLILPKNTNRSIEILSWIKNNLGEDTTVSLMSQYTPYGDIENYGELQRRITRREYEKVLTAAENMGFCNLFVQDPDSSEEKFIPEFDFRGL